MPGSVGRDWPAEGYERFLQFIRAAVDEGRAPQDDWRDAVHDAVASLDRIVRRAERAKVGGIPYLPDDLDDARSAVDALAGIWLDADEAEALYLSGEEP